LKIGGGRLLLTHSSLVGGPTAEIKPGACPRNQDLAKEVTASEKIDQKEANTPFGGKGEVLHTLSRKKTERRTTINGAWSGVLGNVTS